MDVPDRLLTTDDRVVRVVWIALFAAVCFICVLIRIRLLDLPLERDEGEYAYAGQLMLHGIAPYKLAYNMKFPGTYGAYALIMLLFGQTIRGIHLGFLVVNLANVALVLFLGRKLFGWNAGLGAAASYALLSINPAMLGLSAHATHFVILPALAATLLLLRFANSHSARHLFVSGLLFGLALLMKQPGLFFAIFGGVYLIYLGIKQPLRPLQLIRNVLVYVTGVVLPFAATCACLQVAGTFDKFWFWTVTYARDYGSAVPLAVGIYAFAHNWLRVVDSLWLLWIGAFTGLIALIGARSLRRALWFVCSFGCFSILALSAGFYFRPHYFVLVLPFISLLIGAAIAAGEPVRQLWLKLAPAMLLLVALSAFLFTNAGMFFAMPPAQVCRTLYGANPFPEALRIAEFIKSRTTPADKIAVLGSEPEIYFYSDRLSATGYIYMYAAMEPHARALAMQQEIISEIEAARPRCLVITGVDMSWQWPVEGSVLQEWADRYVRENYRAVGLVNIISRETTDYYLPLTGGSAPVGKNYILICERRDLYSIAAERVEFGPGFDSRSGSEKTRSRFQLRGNSR
jgi:hypothetical protein